MKRKKKKKQFRNRLTCISIVLSLVLSMGGLNSFVKYLKTKANERNACYITEATENTKFYEWCLNATDIDTLVYFEEDKAYLYEFDKANFDVETGLYKAITLNGGYHYIPITNATAFANHESAEQYAREILGNDDNIICINYPKHNKTKTLTP